MDEIEQKLRELYSMYGHEAVNSKFRLIDREFFRDDVCTIVVNSGIHRFPDHVLVGEVFVFSQGNIDMESAEAISLEIQSHSRRLVQFLTSKRWRDVRILISGHAILCMFVKIVVHKITGIDTIDIVFNQGSYIDVHVPIRELITS